MQRHRTNNANSRFDAECERRRTAERDAEVAHDGLAKLIEQVDEWESWGNDRQTEISELQAQSDEWKAKWEESKSNVAALQSKSAHYQASARQWQKISKDCQAQLSKCQAESQNGSTQYTCLKRKLKGLTEDDGEPTKKASKR